jgi:hypothetical protein
MNAMLDRGTTMKESRVIDFAKLLGFDTISDQLSDGIDFQDETVGAKLGAKVGDGEADQPVRLPQLPSK